MQKTYPYPTPTHYPYLTLQRVEFGRTRSLHNLQPRGHLAFSSTMWGCKQYHIANVGIMGLEAIWGSGSNIILPMWGNMGSHTMWGCIASNIILLICNQYEVGSNTGLESIWDKYGVGSKLERPWPAQPPGPNTSTEPLQPSMPIHTIAF